MKYKNKKYILNLCENCYGKKSLVEEKVIVRIIIKYNGLENKTYHVDMMEISE